jgi:ankyrin repeat protein
LALKRAIEEGHLHIVQELYQRGANLDFVWLQRLHITPLYLACIMGNIDIINWLCKKGCDSTAVIMNSLRNSPYSTKLVPEASYRELFFWVMIGKNGNNALPPLFNACNDGMTEVVHDLCVKGENVNATMPFTGATALMWACRGGHLEIVRKLCDNGANLVAAMKGLEFSALFIACLCGHTEVVRELCCRGVQIPTAILTWAVRFNKLDIVQELCRRDKLDVNCSSKHGYSALMAAVENCNLAIFRELCNKGARINDQDKYGTTALMIAVQNFDSEDENNGQLQEIIMELCDRGADLNLCDKRGKTALMWALLHGESEEVLQMISSLCDKGANVDACGTNGITPLMIACDRGAHKTVEELLARGANVNAVSGLMRASVFFCKGSGFLRKRPLPRAWWLSFKSALTWRSFSALDFACRSKSLEIAALLLTAGAIKTPGVKETFKVCCEGIICAEGEGGSPVWRRLFQYSRMETRPYTGWSCFSPKARVVPL